MISKLLFAIETGWSYSRQHSNIFLALSLFVFVPLVFLYTGQQFLEAAKSNQNTLQLQRIGFFHDVLAVQLKTKDEDLVSFQENSMALLEENRDIRVVSVIESVDGRLVPLVSVGGEIKEIDNKLSFLIRGSALGSDTLVFPEEENGHRILRAVKSVTSSQGTNQFLYSEHDLFQIDSILAAREYKAYWSLLVVYLFVMLVAIWQIRSTNYQYLYTETKKSNESKDLFTNMIAHELRAPLTAIRGYASMIEEAGHVVEQDKEYVNRIKLSSERLLTIVNDLLDVARIQSGKLAVDFAKVNIIATITAVKDELESSAKEKGVQLVFTSANAQHMAWSDSKRLHQAITNLVSNAIKYTSKGSIEISLEEKPKTLELRIKDTGMGISADDQKKLFAPFFRVQSESVSSITGTGLGMWITQQLIVIMNGTVAVESIKGVGTHVVVNIPKSKVN